MFVVFASTVEFIISATCKGRGPVAEHQSLLSGDTDGAGSCKFILGAA